jgi:hypothetical protein
MVPHAVRMAAALSLVAGTVTSFAATSRADDVTSTSPSPPPPVVVVAPTPQSDTAQTRTVSTGPDLRTIGGGLITLGVSYGIGIAVASNSDHHGDRHLYVPVIGPWLDLGDRGGNCSQSGSCDRETFNRFLIGADGVFQALGVLSIISGFVFEPKREVVTTTTTTASTQATIHITPVDYGRGSLGLAAIGTF